ncbi:DUF4184 family protein [bacterium]|nr:DUF4184 family protein [bacterium]
MAGFRVHIGAGVIAGGVIFGLSFGKFELATSTLALGSLILGSIAPDVDSPNSKSRRYIFGTFLVILITYSLFYSIEKKINGLYLLAIPTAIFLLFQFVFQPLFTKFTIHRGAFHTIPMGIVQSSLFFIIPQIKNSIWISISFFVGFLIHLILDELYAFVHVKGLKIRHKKSFGTAFKWFAPSFWSNVAIYLLIALFYYIYQNDITYQFKLLVNIL